MGVIAVREARNPTASFDPQGARTYTRVFHVDISDPTRDGPVTVWKHLSQDLTPERDRLYFGKPYEFGPVGTDEKDTAYLRGASFRDAGGEDDQHYYEVSVEYGQPTGSDPLATSIPDGGFNPIEVDIDYAQFEEEVEQDVDRNPIFNSAKDPYNPGITRDDSRYVVTITRNEANVDFDLFNQIKDTVNPSPFLGRPARCVKAKPPRARRQWNPDSGYYWVVTYQFEIKDKEYRYPPTAEEPDGVLIGQGWDRVILDAGFRYLDGSDRKQILIDGKQPQEAVPLDGEGGILDPASQPVYRCFRVYPTFDYNALGFGL